MGELLMNFSFTHVKTNLVRPCYAKMLRANKKRRTNVVNPIRVMPPVRVLPFFEQFIKDLSGQTPAFQLPLVSLRLPNNNCKRLRHFHCKTLVMREMCALLVQAVALAGAAFEAYLQPLGMHASVPASVIVWVGVCVGCVFCVGGDVGESSVGVGVGVGMGVCVCVCVCVYVCV